MVNCVSNNTNIALYADDTKIWREINCWNDHQILQNDINSLHSWAAINKMKFHTHKCKVLQVCKNECRLDSILPFLIYFYTLGDTILEYTESEKDLGVLVKSNMSWDDHCLSIFNVAISRMGMVKRVCHFTRSAQQKRSLYLAIVRSNFEHCSIIWRPSSVVMINKLESIQKRAVKWILNEDCHHYNDWEYTCRLRDLKLLPIKYYFAFNDLVIFHKIYNDIYCVKFPSYFRSCDNDDRNRLRSNVNPPNYYNNERQVMGLSEMRATSLDSKSLKCLITSPSAAYRKSFFFRSHLLWNYLPLNIREEQSRKLLVLHLWEEVMKRD